MNHQQFLLNKQWIWWIFTLHKHGVEYIFFKITVESYNATVRISSLPKHFCFCLFLPTTMLLHQRWDVRWWRLSVSKNAFSVLKERTPCSVRCSPCRNTEAQTERSDAEVSFNTLLFVVHVHLLSPFTENCSSLQGARRLLTVWLHFSVFLLPLRILWNRRRRKNSPCFGVIL